MRALRQTVPVKVKLPVVISKRCIIIEMGGPNRGCRNIVDRYQQTNAGIVIGVIPQNPAVMIGMVVGFPLFGNVDLIP